MENAQRQLLSVLLEAIYARGLLSEAAYLNGVDLVHSAVDIPPLFRHPMGLTEGAGRREPA